MYSEAVGRDLTISISKGRFSALKFSLFFSFSLFFFRAALKLKHNVAKKREQIRTARGTRNWTPTRTASCSSRRFGAPSRRRSAKSTLLSSDVTRRLPRPTCITRTFTQLTYKRICAYLLKLVKPCQNSMNLGKKTVTC